MLRTHLFRLFVAFRLCALFSPVLVWGVERPPTLVDQVTPLTIGTPSPTVCSGTTPAVVSGIRDALPGAWRNPERYGSGWDLHRDETSGAMSLTWYTYDSARRPVWYRSSIAQVDPSTLTWRAAIQRVGMNPQTARRVPAEDVGAVAIRFLQDQPGKFVVRWWLNGTRVPPADECLLDVFGEARASQWRPQRWFDPASGAFEFLRTALAEPSWAGHRFVVLGFDSIGAPVWTAGVLSQSAESSPVPLDYYYSNFPGGVPRANCAHTGCISAPRRAGQLSTATLASAPQATLSLQMVSAEVAQTVQQNRSGTVQPLAGAQTALSSFSITVSPPGNCALSAGVTSCTKLVTWSTSEPVVSIVQVRTDVSPPAMTGLGHSLTGSANVNLTNGTWVFQIRDPFSPLVYFETAPIVVGNGTPPLGGNIGFQLASNCRNSSVPVTPGTTPGISGRWWNSQRDSTGWDLVFTEPTATNPNGQVSATWSTFGSDSEPVWLVASSLQIESALEPGQTVKRAWGPLLRFTWNGSSATSTVVGEVSFTFVHDDATRASLRWKWSEAPGAFYDECISEFSRQAAGRSPEVNQAYTGSWYEPTLDGYGYSVYLASGTDTSLVDAMILNAYDATGQPRWVIGTTVNPVAGWTDIPMYYLRSAFPGGVPTSNCTGNGCRSLMAAGTVSRMFNGDGATGSAKVAINYSPGSVSLSWYRFGNPPTPVSIAKIARTDEIVANRQLCTISGSACQILISWTSSSADARAYRVDLASQVWTPLEPQLAVGTSTQSFSASGRYRYVLAKPGSSNLQFLATSAEVVISGQLPLSSQVSVDRTSCTLGSAPCNVLATWSTNVNSTARVYRRRLDGPGGTFRLPVDSANSSYTDNITAAGSYRYELNQTDSPSGTNLAVSPAVIISAAPVASTCSFADWTTVVGTPIAGGPSDSPAIPRYRGRCGIRAVAIGDYLVDASPSVEDSYNPRFYYYTGDRSGGTADIFQARSASGTTLLRVQHDGNSLYFSANGGATTRSVIVADNRWYMVRLNWTTGAGNGSLAITVTGNGNVTPLLTPAITGLNNQADRIEEARLGLISGTGAGAVAFDEFEARRYTAPVRRCRGDANDDQVLNVTDLAMIQGEIVGGGAPISPGQPDFNEDGVVNVTDLALLQGPIVAGLGCNAM